MDVRYCRRADTEFSQVGTTLLRVLKTLTAGTYFPAVTNISSRHLEKSTVVALPTLRPAAGLPQMASLFAMLHTTTLPKQEGPKRSGGDRLSKRRNKVFLVVLESKEEKE